MSAFVVEVESDLPAPVARVWERVTSVEGINHELGPWLSMSVPRGRDDLAVDAVPLGVPLGRAWVRLLGVVPVEYDDLCVVELEPGRRFREESSMLTARRWGHERTLTSLGPDSTVVHDRLTVEPRVAGALTGPVAARLVRLLFEHRHRRLLAHFR